ncbi:MAG: hypothetical protein R2856_19870 [Caldilineaceae bacterium]
MTLTNPTSVVDTFTVTVGGVPGQAWLTYSDSVPMAANETKDIVITVEIPDDAAADVLPLIVDVSTAAAARRAYRAS